MVYPNPPRGSNHRLRHARPAAYHSSTVCVCVCVCVGVCGWVAMSNGYGALIYHRDTGIWSSPRIPVHCFVLLHCSANQISSECCLEVTAQDGYRMLHGPSGSAHHRCRLVTDHAHMGTFYGTPSPFLSPFTTYTARLHADARTQYPGHQPVPSKHGGYNPLLDPILEPTTTCPH